MENTAGKEISVNASAIALEEKGVLIIGPSGSGKSTLAIEMISLGAILVADDQTNVMVGPDGLYLSPPKSNAGLIESRYLGILKLPWQENIKLTTVIDLSKMEKKRLPPFRTHKLLNYKIPCIYAKGNRIIAKALYVLLIGERKH